LAVRQAVQASLDNCLRKEAAPAPQLIERLLQWIPHVDIPTIPQRRDCEAGQA
jgi:hypothetical protein